MSNLSKGNTQEGSLGLVACVTMIAGGMIGSAIFSLSGMTIYYAGPAAVLSWLIAAIILLMYGLQVAELSTIFPKSGGVFVFPSKSLGRNETQGKIWGWFSVWGYITSNIAGIAFSAIYVATYLGVGFPIFAKYQILMAVGAVVLCSVLNFYKISVAGKANTILVSVLVLTMLVFIAVGLFGGSWESDLLTPFFSQGIKGASGFVSAIPNAMVAYGSIVAVAFMVSEVKNPNKNVPKSIAIAMGIVVFIYSLIIITTVGLVTAEFLVENPGMRFIPLYAAAFTKLQMFPWLPKVISISAVMALLTTILVLIAITARAIFATAEAGLLPKFLAKIDNKTGTPLNATILVALATSIISCFPQFTAEIVNLGSLFAAITIIINCYSLVVARRKFSHIEGNYRAPGGTFLPIITLAVIIATYIPRILEGSTIIYFTLAWYAVAAVIIAFVLRQSPKTKAPIV
ncbi:APC family permease [Alkaliphilus peptidifermentans]|uniref:Amino acid/polyamine/organocation transporter, APC superfamily (TC 2.A.3) n=1 Tax=Alkaliphilus peptidifermentans DSM 18978 TaxID=1120976 RepID=A0A1G5CTD5_9FIRM|nr:APC family permease [Alkaliphilus peptidifermentans]SCY05662.1 amino acid/polyamine/organocation transporter, APC superfamily (TC 2.A.3) [Alkaliphilus peptidifermentans DSM 18978]